MSRIRGVAGVRVVAQGGGPGGILASVGGGPGVVGVVTGGASVDDGGGDPGPPPAPPAAPVAAFTLDPSSGLGPLTVAFTDTSTGEIASWLWDFDDGTTSNNQNPTHVFTFAGNFTVTLTVTNSGGSDNTFQIVAVTGTVPVADFSGTPLSGLAPLTVDFTSLATGSVDTRLWNFGDGATSTELDPTHTYQTDGSWDVSLSLEGPAGTDIETKSGYVNTGEPTGLPAGYQTPGQTHNYVVDMSSYVPGAHVMTQALVTELDALLASGSPPVDGDHIAFCLPALTSTGFSIDGIASGPDIDPSAWPDINIHLVGPYAPLGTDKTFIFDPDSYSFGDTITIEPTADWASRIEFWSIEFNARARKIVGHGSKDESAGGASPGPHSPMGSSIKFHQCDFLESANSPVSNWPETSGDWSHLWCVHTFWTTPFFEDCRFNLPHQKEHIAYVHHTPATDGGMRNCWIESCGSQVWQETVRAHIEPTDACWSTASFEGEYMGRGTTTLERVYVDETVGYGTVPANVFNNYASGRDWVIRDCHIKMLNNPPVNSEGVAADPEDRSPGCLLVSANTAMDRRGPTQCNDPTSWYWREDDHGGSSGGRSFANYSLIIEDSTFISNTGKALLDIASISGSVLIRHNFFGSLDNTGGAGEQSIRFCRENINGSPGTSWLHMVNDSDCADVTFVSNNDPTDPVNGPVGRATNPAVTRFSAPLPAVLVNNAITNPLGVLAGVDSVTGGSGPQADSVVIGDARDEWVNDTTTFVEYP